MDTPFMETVPELGLLIVISCEALVEPRDSLPKLRLVVEVVSVLPTPVRVTTCGLAASLSVIVRRPNIVPAELGVNVTFTWQV
jgi:hypothetical protein